MSEKVDQYVQPNQSRFLEELKDLLRIPSISTLPEHNGDMHKPPSTWRTNCAPRGWRTSS